MSAPIVIMLDPRRHPDQVGFIPDFLDLDDERPAREQFNERYAFGGGWRPQDGFTHAKDYALHFPGDPPYEPIAFLPFRDEKVFVYKHAFVAIFQRDGSFEACRMD